MTRAELPADARVVVIGGGIVGCSVAYHLGKLGYSDTVLLERDVLTSGTSWHAAGIVGPLRSSYNLTRLSMYAVELFEGLETETGQATGYRRTGGLWLAQTQDRMAELHRTSANGEIAGLEAGIITPAEVARHWPQLKVDDLAGALWVPADGQTNPVDTTMAYAKGARQSGVKIIEKTPVERIETRGGCVTGVMTADGRISCEYVVNCCGMWARQLGATVGVNVPLQAAEHVYFVTEAIDGLPDPMPVTRDLDAGVYFKEDAGKLVVGGFEKEARPWCVDGIPEDASYTILPEDWDRYAIFLEDGIHRLPVLEKAGIRTFMNGPESFTPDTRQVMGEAPNLKGFFVAAGFNSIGVVSSAGAGKVIAEWIDGGEPPMDVWEVDIQRFAPEQGTRDFLAARTVETLGDLLNIHWPYKQPRTARNIRKTPFHDRFAQTGACFGAPAMAWERPLWFAREGEQPEVRYSYGEQSWWPNAEREALATRYAAALYELTPFAKFEVSGPDAEAQLQRLVAADLGVEAGRTVYGQMLNRHGGIEADVTVIRLAEDRFWMIGGAPTRIKDRTWLQRNMATGARADISDITEDYAVLGLMGPNARSILMRVSSADFSNDTFAFSTSQMIEIGGATVRANRLSFVGELGWELYIPNMHALPVYDRLSEAGKESGLIPAGLFSVDSCRLEKGFRHWSHDMGPEETPLEIGLGFAVAFNKGVDFIGRDALLRQREAGIEKRLVLFSVSDGEEVPLILHDEPVYRNGERVGQTTSGGRAFRVGGSLAFVMLHGPRGVSWDWIESGSYEIKVAGKMYNMLPLRRAPYDPDGKLLKN